MLKRLWQRLIDWLHDGDEDELADLQSHLDYIAEMRHQLAGEERATRAHIAMLEQRIAARKAAQGSQA